MPRSQRSPLPLVLLALALLLAACARAEPPATLAAAPEAAPAPVEAQAADADLAPTDPNAALAGERKVIHQAELTLRSEAVARTADLVVAIVERAEGYVATREEGHTDGHVTRGVLSLRVPAAAFDRVLAELKQDAEVVSQRISGQDVTAEYTDNAARLRAQRVLEERLLGLSAAQRGVKDLLEVERELARVRAEIERLTGVQQLLDHQTAYATISLTIVSPQQPVLGATQGVFSQLANAVSDGLDGALFVALAFVRVGLLLLPFLPLPVFGYLLWRMRRRRLLVRGQA